MEYKSVCYTFKNRKSVFYTFFYPFTANLITTGLNGLERRVFSGKRKRASSLWFFEYNSVFSNVGEALVVEINQALVLDVLLSLYPYRSPWLWYFWGLRSIRYSSTGSIFRKTKRCTIYQALGTFHFKNYYCRSTKENKVKNKVTEADILTGDAAAFNQRTTSHDSTTWTSINKPSA